MLENFIYAKEKSLFEKALNNGEVLDEAIVFIEDTKEIWNHGTYFDGSTFDSTDIEASILELKLNYFKWSTIFKLITFTILGVEHQAEKGMTWEDFINSSYNDGTYRILEGKVWTLEFPVLYKGNEIECTDTIIENYDYIHYGGGNN